MTESARFSIYLDNLFTCDKAGGGAVAISPSMLRVPRGLVPNGSATLEDMIKQVGPQSVRMSWYVSALGKISESTFWIPYTLYAGADVGNRALPPVPILMTNNKPGSSHQQWLPILSNTSEVLSRVYTASNDDGTGCRFNTAGGWENTAVSVRVDVEVEGLVPLVSQAAPVRPYIREHMTPTSEPFDSTPSWVWWIVAVIVVLLILAMLGGLGYYIKHKKQTSAVMGTSSTMKQ